MPALTTYVLLVLAIASEILATSMLQASQQFTRTGPTILMGLAYGVSFYLLTLVLKVMPLGVTYAIWSGLGILFVTLVGWMVFRQALDLPAIIGIAMIIGGVLVLNLFSDSVRH